MGSCFVLLPLNAMKSISMECKILLLRLFALVGLAANGFAADTVFSENFDNPEVYSVGEMLPAGYGFIHHGNWALLSGKNQMGTIIARDGNQCLDLNLSDVSPPGTKARAIGTFGRTNQEATVVTKPLEFRIALQFSKTPDESFYLMLYGTDGKSKATIGVADGGLNVSFGGKRQSFGGTIEPNVWYEVQLLLPADSATNSTFTANLYAADGSLLDSKTGRLSRTVDKEKGINYTGFDIQHQLPGLSLLIDKITATEE